MAKPRVHTASYYPHRCAILGIDTAAISGYAVRVWGQLRMSGQCDTLVTERVESVTIATRDLAQKLGLQLVIVFEAPYGGNVSVVTALGAARERWMRPIRESGLHTAPVVRVQPSRWRVGLWGRGWGRAERDVIRAHEQQQAALETGRPDLGPDEAAAIHITRWAAHAPDVAKRLRPADRHRRPNQ